MSERLPYEFQVSIFALSDDCSIEGDVLLASSIRVFLSAWHSMAVQHFDGCDFDPHMERR